MRIRSTKPEFWKSRRIASVSWDARLVLKGLESYVDDNGVGIDDIELIVTDVFPRDMFAKGSETVGRVSEAITELHQAGLVHRYTTETDRLLYISWWESIQRIDKPGKGRNPRPDGTWNYRDSEIRESVASLPETLAPGTEEQGNRGTEEQGNRGTELRVTLSDADAPDHEPEEFELIEEELPVDDVDTTPGYPADFTRFWEIYPRRGGKGAACTAFIKAKKRANVETIIAGAERLRDDPNLPEGKLIPMPSTWLNQDRWEDDPLPPRADLSKSDQRLQQGFDLVQRVAAKGKGGLDCDPFEKKEIES
ncbi:hypothetical protein [Glutamicibacter halophytocola]|uniref:hypothetical protein n=1 Tax=Glutamicibacter halophytocola TaxID=1933880 RepID=UPI001A9CAD59|nr:hypothetical protein [Glutamicibacter halophytocola]